MLFEEGRNVNAGDKVDLVALNFLINPQFPPAVPHRYEMVSVETDTVDGVAAPHYGVY